MEYQNENQINLHQHIEQEREMPVNEGNPNSSLHPPAYNTKGTIPSSPQMIEDYKVYAGFWMRFWAYLIDLLIISSISNILIHSVLAPFGVKDTGGMFSIHHILSAIIFYSYFVFMTKYFSQTLGKMIFGLKVIPIKGEKLTWSTVLFREWIGRYISVTIILLYLVVIFLPKKQGLHDVFSDTAVIHERVILKEPVITYKY